MKKSSVSKKRISPAITKREDKENAPTTYTKKFKQKKVISVEKFGVKSYSMNSTIINNSHQNSRSTSSRSKLKRSPVENYFTMAKKSNKDLKCVEDEKYPQTNKFIDVTDSESNGENYMSFDNSTPNNDPKNMSPVKKQYRFQDQSSKKKSRNHGIILQKVDTISTLPQKGISFQGMPKLNKTQINKPFKNYIEPKVNQKIKVILSTKKLTPRMPDTLVSSLVTENMSLLKKSKQSPRDYQKYVWYAAYDEDLLSQNLYNKLIEINNNIDSQEIYPLRVQSSILPGYQLCFDQALSDYPYVREYSFWSPETKKQNGNKEIPNDFVYAKLYLIKKTQLIELLKYKAVDGQKVKHQIKFTDNLLEQYIENIDKLDHLETEESDDNERLEKLVSQHLIYLHYNCIKQVQLLEGLPVFFISSDQNTNFSPGQYFQGMLPTMLRYQLFSRIRDRAGCPSSRIMRKVKESHQNQLKQIYLGIQENFRSITQKNYDNQIIEYIKRCLGVFWDQQAWNKSDKSYELIQSSAELRMQTYITNVDDASSLILSMKKFESLLKNSMVNDEDSPDSHHHVMLPKPFHIDDMPQIEEMPDAECQTEQSKVDFEISSTNQSQEKIKYIKYEVCPTENNPYMHDLRQALNLKSRSSQQAQDQRSQIINEMLNNPTAYTGFEEKNFEGGGKRNSELNDLSKSLVNSIMLKKKMASLHSEASQQKITNNSSEKLHVLRRFGENVLQPIKTESEDSFESQKQNLADFFMDQLIQISSSKKSETLEFNKSLGDLVPVELKKTQYEKLMQGLSSLMLNLKQDYQEKFQDEEFDENSQSGNCPSNDLDEKFSKPEIAEFRSISVEEISSNQTSFIRGSKFMKKWPQNMRQAVSMLNK